MPRLFVNTFTPLVASAAGALTSEKYGIPPFADSSIRREPDLEHEFPSISCLCRAGHFAPRLRVGDVVVYMTKKGKHHSISDQSRRLVAILRVHELFESHSAAAAWYRASRLPLPGNCMVSGNPAKPLDQSHRMYQGDSSARVSKRCKSSCGGSSSSSGSSTSEDRRIRTAWDAEYKDRARRFPKFVICKPLFVQLSWDAPVADDSFLVGVFGGIPSTQNPGALPIKLLDSLAAKLGLPAPPSRP